MGDNPINGVDPDGRLFNGYTFDLSNFKLRKVSNLGGARTHFLFLIASKGDGSAILKQTLTFSGIASFKRLKETLLRSKISSNLKSELLVNSMVNTINDAGEFMGKTSVIAMSVYFPIARYAGYLPKIAMASKSAATWYAVEFLTLDVPYFAYTLDTFVGNGNIRNTTLFGQAASELGNQRAADIIDKSIGLSTSIMRTDINKPIKSSLKTGRKTADLLNEIK